MRIHVRQLLYYPAVLQTYHAVLFRLNGPLIVRRFHNRVSALSPLPHVHESGVKVYLKLVVVVGSCIGRKMTQFR